MKFGQCCLQKTSSTNAINNPPTPSLPANLLPLYVITSKFATDTVIRYDDLVKLTKVGFDFRRIEEALLLIGENCLKNVFKRLIAV